MLKIPQPRFNLKSPKSAEATLIFLVFRFNGNRIQHSTSITIHPKDWDFRSQKPKLNSQNPRLFEISNELEALSSKCIQIYLDSNYGRISINDFKLKLCESNEELESSFNEALEGSPLIDFIEKELESMKASKMKLGSYKSFLTHANLIREFSSIHYNSTPLKFEDIDWNFRLKLIDWLSDKNVQLGYGNKTLKILNQFMERARRKKLHSNTEYLGAGWTVRPTKAKGQLVTLSIDELEAISKMELDGHLAKIRDILLIGCGTGQRHSDFSKYRPENFYTTQSGIPILSFVSDKTATPTKVPLNIFPWLIPVLEKHGYKTPQMSNQKFNDGLKDLCELMELNQPILVVNQYMGRKPRIEKLFELKKNLVASHICRRSFATNLYLLEINLSQIMPITGHSTESQLKQYIGLDVEQNAEEVGKKFKYGSIQYTYPSDQPRSIKSQHNCYAS
jgi:hypothetical protein